ncbi:MarR family winged helix-turn-helix transcriptional regulator [Neptunicoccus cionae]|uniref:MarR family winged helix-turn-helix transcriptional regulator n=1 Tax=Neptunicoccus cionae TaxID=2035344 RepID=UPI0015E0628F|nr:MarR family winged helix-turn-helix transcriptional regulator [Amylibacter cionae]
MQPKMEERLPLVGHGNRKLRYSEIITYRVAQLHTRFNAQSTRILQTVSNISLAQWRILTVVNSADDVTHTKISMISKIDKGQISRAVKSLIRDGYLETEHDLDDHRKSYLKLTPLARDLLDKTLPLMQKRHDVLTESLSADQRRVLFEAFDTLDTLTELTEFAE